MDLGGDFSWFDTSCTLAEMIAATGAWPKSAISAATQIDPPPSGGAITQLAGIIEQPPAQAIAQLLQVFACGDAPLAWVPPAETAAGAVMLDDNHPELGGLLAPPDIDLRGDAQWSGLVSAMTILHRVHQWRCRACRDPLTGAYNRGFFDCFLRQAIHLAQTTQAPVTVLVLDVDDFKQFNDAHGHATGDQILIALVQLLTSLTRPHDVVARIGGDEFAVVFSETEPPRQREGDRAGELPLLVERFQQAVAAFRFPTLNIPQARRLRVSTGMANLRHTEDDAASLLARADRATLKAKQEGKDLLTLGPDQPSR